MAQELNCNSNCSSCSVACDSRNEAPTDFLVKLHPYSQVRKVIGIVSGKGGVGKSLVTSLMAVEIQRRKLRAAILDGDITGPSIPKIFGTHEKASGTQKSIFPNHSNTGIQTISINNLLEDDTQPVVWRGPIIADVVKQFWSDVVWEEVDYMFVDMPPGTGDVPLTVFQSIPLDGILIVTSPQQLVTMVVTKAIHVANMMNIPILGIIENMSYVECPDCDKKIEIFGKSHLEEFAAEHGLTVLARIPLQAEIATLCDGGEIESYTSPWLTKAVDQLLLKLNTKQLGPRIKLELNANR